VVSKARGPRAFHLIPFSCKIFLCTSNDLHLIRTHWIFFQSCLCREFALTRGWFERDDLSIGQSSCPRPSPCLNSLPQSQWLILRPQPFVGSMGCVCAIVFTCFGAAYGTAKAGVGVCSTAVLRPDLVVKSMSLPSAGRVCRRVLLLKNELFSLLETATLTQTWFNRHSSGCDGWHYRDLWLSRFCSCRKWPKAESPLIYRLDSVLCGSLRRPCRLSIRVSCVTDKSRDIAEIIIVSWF
jgi:hypothetical protein